MSYQIDYLSVGDGETSGDAIALRYGNFIGSVNDQSVAIIDGGTKESGKELVNTVKNYYGTDIVDYVICTHQDSDHASGLTEVLNNLKVTNLIIHMPWEHEKAIIDLFKYPFTDKQLEDNIQKSMENVNNLVGIALEKGTNIWEPFAGLHANNWQILGPTQDYYESLIPLFRNTPQPVKTLEDILRVVQQQGSEIIKRIRETLDPSTETLDDSGVTSAENNSSVITLFNLDGRKILFTGDAGIDALNRAADFALANGVDISKVFLLHVPHHGSKHSVGKSVLNRISAEHAQISVSNGSSKHPSKRVTNALIRRQTKVYTTQGSRILWHSSDAGRGWDPSNTVEFCPEFDDTDD